MQDDLGEGDAFLHMPFQSDAVLFLFNVMDMNSFETVEYFLQHWSDSDVYTQRTKTWAGGERARRKMKFSLLANQADIPIEDWKVPLAKAEELSMRMQIPLHLVSAKTGLGLEKSDLDRMVIGALYRRILNARATDRVTNDIVKHPAPTEPDGTCGNLVAFFLPAAMWFYRIKQRFRLSSSGQLPLRSEDQGTRAGPPLGPAHRSWHGKWIHDFADKPAARSYQRPNSSILAMDQDKDKKIEQNGDENKDEAVAVRAYLDCSPQPPDAVKCAVLGYSGSGKYTVMTRVCSLISSKPDTQLTQMQISYGYFGEVYDPTTEDWRRPCFDICGHSIQTEWRPQALCSPDLDSSQAKHYLWMSLMSAFDSDSVLLLYNPFRMDTFTSLDDFFKLWLEYWAVRTMGWTEPQKARQRTKFYVVATRVDRVDEDWEVPIESAKRFSKSIGAPLLQTSAKTGLGLEPQDIARLVTQALHHKSLKETAAKESLIRRPWTVAPMNKEDEKLILAQIAAADGTDKVELPPPGELPIWKEFGPGRSQHYGPLGRRLGSFL